MRVIIRVMIREIDDEKAILIKRLIEKAVADIPEAEVEMSFLPR